MPCCATGVAVPLSTGCGEFDSRTGRHAGLGVMVTITAPNREEGVRFPARPSEGRSPGPATRASFNRRTSVFQTDDEGAIPSARTMSRFSGEDRRLQPGARGFDSLSALRLSSRGTGSLGTAPVRQAGGGRCNPCVPHESWACLRGKISVLQTESPGATPGLSTAAPAAHPRMAQPG